MSIFVCAYMFEYEHALPRECACVYENVCVCESMCVYICREVSNSRHVCMKRYMKNCVSVCDYMSVTMCV